jgi:hypothetical protein
MGKTIVVFRKFRSGGDILALFPELAATHDGRYCESYQHVGQHSGADYEGCIAVSVPARPEEYGDLARELTRIGYDLEIRKAACGGSVTSTLRRILCLPA